MPTHDVGTLKPVVWLEGAGPGQFIHCEPWPEQRLPDVDDRRAANAYNSWIRAMARAMANGGFRA